MVDFDLQHRISRRPSYKEVRNLGIYQLIRIWARFHVDQHHLDVSQTSKKHTAGRDHWNPDQQGSRVFPLVSNYFLVPAIK